LLVAQRRIHITVSLSALGTVVSLPESSPEPEIDALQGAATPLPDSHPEKPVFDRRFVLPAGTVSRAPPPRGGGTRHRTTADSVRQRPQNTESPCASRACSRSSSVVSNCSPQLHV